MPWSLRRSHSTSISTADDVVTILVRERVLGISVCLRRCSLLPERAAGSTHVTVVVVVVARPTERSVVAVVVAVTVAGSSERVILIVVVATATAVCSCYHSGSRKDSWNSLVFMATIPTAQTGRCYSCYCWSWSFL